MKTRVIQEEPEPDAVRVPVDPAAGSPCADDDAGAARTVVDDLTALEPDSNGGTP